MQRGSIWPSWGQQPGSGPGAAGRHSTSDAGWRWPPPVGGSAQRPGVGVDSKEGWNKGEAQQVDGNIKWVPRGKVCTRQPIGHCW
jgi:hypothetical protein